MKRINTDKILLMTLSLLIVTVFTACKDEEAANSYFDTLIPQYLDIRAQYEKDHSDTELLKSLQLYYSSLPAYYITDEITPWEMLGYYRHTRFNTATGWDRFLSQLSKVNSYAKDKSLYGIISSPTVSSKKHGIAIISHGFNGTHDFGRNYFKTLNELGYAAYAFDFPCGSIFSKTDNNTQNMSVTDEKEVLKSIVRYFQKQKDIDKDNIILIGESQGGLDISGMMR